MVFPPSVKPGDTVMLVSPSSPLVKDQPVEELAQLVETLGFRAVSYTHLTLPTNSRV